ncbi:hypothetical protein [Streptomyces sp. NPDC049915]|uniref:hypothetical protein n=1 Tax=Streptomyces sp. NPDC049915 TaxID=3155510 RepID=UPI00342467A6
MRTPDAVGHRLGLVAGDLLIALPPLALGPDRPEEVVSSSYPRDQRPQPAY